MDQLEFFEIPSPCIGVCQSGPKGYCLDCFRSREERLHWVQLKPDLKRKIIKVCAARKKRALTGKVPKEDDSLIAEQISLWPEDQ